MMGNHDNDCDCDGCTFTAIEPNPARTTYRIEVELSRPDNRWGALTHHGQPFDYATRAEAEAKIAELRTTDFYVKKGGGVRIAEVTL